MSVEIKVAESEAEIDAVREMMREYTSWAISLDPAAVGAPTFAGLEDELAGLPGVYASPGGRLLIAVASGEVVGCICLKPHDAEVCEVKRLYVRPDRRGLNLGSRLVARLIEEARHEGYRRIVLDSHVSMIKAHEIYAAAGFVYVPPPADFPEHIKSRAVFMECAL